LTLTLHTANLHRASWFAAGFTRFPIMSRRFLALLLAAPAAGCASAPSPSQAPAPAVAAAPAQDYLLWVGSEGDDRLSLVRFGPAGARVERDFRTGLVPSEVAGPHGVAVSPDGRHFYVSTAHGFPFGSLWKYTTVGDTLVGRIELGNFPATLQTTPDGQYVYVVNFNLHGEMVPSSVSIVYAPEMVEVARVTTCTMPHGSRLNPQGTKHYSACMMDDMLVEIDTRTLGISRHFSLRKGMEHGGSGAPMTGAGEHGAHHGTAAGGHAMPAPTCSPTWAQPSADGGEIFVACQAANEIVVVDAGSWAVTRRFPAGPGVYNLAVTRDGRLVVATNKKGQSVSVFEAASGKELARIPTTRRVPSGLVVSPDDRYAFITLEGVGAEPGTVEVIDLRTLASVATADVGPQAGGIDFWKMEPARGGPARP
jgi:DNA-binding beta-propeller fold protein YncE